jgi:hypothetical protein
MGKEDDSKPITIIHSRSFIFDVLRIVYGQSNMVIVREIQNCLGRETEQE